MMNIMEKTRAAKKKIITKSYLRLIPVSMIIVASANICGFIDNIIISRYLGAGALAAVGYFSPMQAIFGLSFVLTFGTMILCGNYIGSGQKDKVNSLFTGSFFTLLTINLIFILSLVMFRGKISNILCAGSSAAGLLEDFILSLALSLLFSPQSALLLSLIPYNNEIGKSYIAAAVMLLGKLLLNLLLVKPLGLFGIGLASSISDLAMLLILLPSFMKKTNTIYLKLSGIDLRLVGYAVKRGMSILLFYAGLIIKNSLMNYALILHSGDDGIAVVNVLASVCGITGTIMTGFVNAYATLGSLYYGEEDRESLMDLFKEAFVSGSACTMLMVITFLVFSGPLADFFFERGMQIWSLGQRMFMLGFLYLPFALIFILLLNTSRIQGKMLMVNILSFIETGLIGVLAVLTVPIQGTDAAWLANTWSDIICLIIILISIFVNKKRPGLSLTDIMKLPDDFGAAKDQFAEFSVAKLPDVSAVSNEICRFCESRNVDPKRTVLAGLCVEELTRNTLEHGGYHRDRNNINVRVVCKDELTIRIQDDCLKFDPCARMKMFAPEKPEENIGLRMVAGLAKDMNYYNNAGINSLIIKL